MRPVANEAWEADEFGFLRDAYAREFRPRTMSQQLLVDMLAGDTLMLARLTALREHLTAPQNVPTASGPTKGNGGDTRGTRAVDRSGACVAAMLRTSTTDQADGSRRLFAAACRVVEYDLNDQAGVAAIRAYAKRLPFPKESTDVDILRRVREAEEKVERGVQGDADAEGKVRIMIVADEHRVVSKAFVYDLGR